MSDFSPPKDSRDWLFKTMKLVGVEAICEIWGKSKAHVYAWAANPRTNGEVRENFIEKLDQTIDLLSNSGDTGEKLARWPAQHYCDLTSLNTIPKDFPLIHDKATWEEELLDDEGPWYEYRRACRMYRAGKVGTEVVKYWEDQLMRELKETTATVLSPEPRAQ